MNKKPTYEWLQDEGKAICKIYWEHQVFTGIAQCHPDDEDMKSRLTGQFIAEARATLKYLSFVKNYDLRPQLKSLKQLYYSANRSSQYSKKDYLSKMLYRHIRDLENDIIAINERIVGLKQTLSEYLTNKEEYYQQIRKNRKLVKEN